jgi:hypothetical protein
MWQWGHRCVTDRWIITGGGDGAPSWGAVVSGGARDRGGRGGGGAASIVSGRQAGMEGRSDRGMKTHEEDEVVG